MSGPKPFNIPRQWVWKAWLRVRSNNGSGGIDGISLAEFGQDYKAHLYWLWNRMSSGSYMPPAVKLMEIPKKGGGKRPLGIPTIADRVAQTVVKVQLEQELEPLFHEDSYGCRPGKSAIQAVAKARQRCWAYDWVIDLDIKGFFDNIPHDLLMKAVRKHCDCRWMLYTLKDGWPLPCKPKTGGIIARSKGVPQGSVIGSLLANLYLHYCMDQWLSIRYPDCPFERYADDAIIHCRRKQQAEQVREHLQARMRACGLELHPEKTHVVYCTDSNRRGNYGEVSFDFLGYTFKPGIAQNGRRKVWLTS